MNIDQPAPRWYRRGKRIIGLLSGPTFFAFVSILNPSDHQLAVIGQVIAFIPVLILILAYAHSIPIPPELMLVGDVLAYIDIYSAIFLLGIMSRAATILFIMKRVAAHAFRLASSLLAGTKRLDFRHRREGGAKSRKGTAGRGRT